MLTMTEKKPKRGRPQKHPEAGTSGRSGRSIHLTLSPKLMQVVDAYRETLEFPPAYTDLAERAIEAYLASKGLWPPQEKE